MLARAGKLPDMPGPLRPADAAPIRDRPGAGSILDLDQSIFSCVFYKVLYI
jgi:hypothetical protein